MAVALLQYHVCRRKLPGDVSCCVDTKNSLLLLCKHGLTSGWWHFCQYCITQEIPFYLRIAGVKIY